MRLAVIVWTALGLSPFPLLVPPPGPPQCNTEGRPVSLSYSKVNASEDVFAIFALLRSAAYSIEKREIDALMAYWAPGDVVLMPPKSPPLQTRREIASWYTDNPFHLPVIDSEAGVFQDLKLFGNYALVRGSWCLPSHPGEEDGREGNGTMEYVALLGKSTIEEQDRWQIAEFIWTERWDK